MIWIKSRLPIFILGSVLVLSLPLIVFLSEPLLSSVHIRNGNGYIHGLLWDEPVRLVWLRQGAVEFQTAIEYDFYQWEPHFRLGHTFLAMSKLVKDKEKKRSLLKKCVVELNTADRFQIRSETHFFLGEAYADLGDMENAVYSYHLAYFYRDRPFQEKWLFRVKIRELWKESIQLANLYFDRGEYTRSILILKNLIHVQEDESNGNVPAESRALVYALWDGVKGELTATGKAGEPDWGGAIRPLDPKTAYEGLVQLARMGIRGPVLKISPLLKGMEPIPDSAVACFPISDLERG